MTIIESIALLAVMIFLIAVGLYIIIDSARTSIETHNELSNPNDYITRHNRQK